MLDDIILLWDVGRSILTMHALSRVVLCELNRGEFTSLIGPERPQFQVELFLFLCLDVLDGSLNTIFGGDHGYPHEPGEIIHKQASSTLPCSHGRSAHSSAMSPHCLTHVPPGMPMVID